MTLERCFRYNIEMKREQLKVEKRTVLGKKIKKLRREGILPANIYGKDIQSVAVQVPYKDFEVLYKEVGETGLIDVAVDGELRPALIHNVQYDSVTRLPIHADLYQVNLKEKITTMVPVEVVGEAKAVTEQTGMLMQPLSEIEVEALPTDLPEKIEINVEHLAAVDDQVTVGQLKIPAGVEVKTDSGQVVVKIAELVSEEAKEVAAEMAAEAEAATEATEGEEGKAEEGEEKADGEQTTEGDDEEKPASAKSSGEAKEEKKD